MIDYSARWYPNAVTSVTLSTYFRKRPNTGSGAYGSCPIPDLTVVYPTGRDGGVPIASINEAIIQHFINNDQTGAVWSPKNGSREDLLRKALNDCPVLSAGTAQRMIFIDGEFGNVYCG